MITALDVRYDDSRSLGTEGAVLTGFNQDHQPTAGCARVEILVRGEYDFEPRLAFRDLE